MSQEQLVPIQQNVGENPEMSVAVSENACTLETSENMLQGAAASTGDDSVVESLDFVYLVDSRKPGNVATSDKMTNKLPASTLKLDKELKSIQDNSHPKLINHENYLAHITSIRHYCNEAWKAYQLALVQKCYDNEMSTIETEVSNKKVYLKEKLLTELLTRKRKLVEEKQQDLKVSLVAEGEENGKVSGTGGKSKGGIGSRKQRNKKSGVVLAALGAMAGNISDSGMSVAPVTLTRQRATLNAAAGIPSLANNLTFSSSASVSFLSVLNAIVPSSTTAGGPIIQESLRDLEVEQDLDIFRQKKGIHGPVTRRTIKSIKASFNHHEEI